MGIWILTDWIISEWKTDFNRIKNWNFLKEFNDFQLADALGYLYHWILP